MSTSTLKVREAPVDGNTIETVSLNEAGNIIGKNADDTWLYMRFDNGLTGWVAAYLVTHDDLTAVPVIPVAMQTPETPAETEEPPAEESQAGESQAGEPPAGQPTPASTPPADAPSGAETKNAEPAPAPNAVTVQPNTIMDRIINGSPILNAPTEVTVSENQLDSQGIRWLHVNWLPQDNRAAVIDGWAKLTDSDWLRVTAAIEAERILRKDKNTTSTNAFPGYFLPEQARLVLLDAENSGGAWWLKVEVTDFPERTGWIEARLTNYESQPQ